MPPLLAVGPPGEPFSGALFGMAQVIALLPVTILLAWALLPGRFTTTPRFTSCLHPAWRAARLALGCAIAAGLCVIGSLLARGFGRDPEGFFGWLGNTLYAIAGFAAFFIVCSKLPRHPKPDSRPRHWFVPVAILLLASILTALWWHDQPHLHLLLLKKVSLPFILGTFYAAWLAGTPAGGRLSRFTAIAHILLPGVIALSLSWHTARATAAWQDQRASAYAAQVLSLIQSHLAQHGHAPPQLPAEAIATAPPGWRGQLAYVALGREFTLIYPLTLHPGAQMHYDSEFPKWVWHGASDF